MGARLNSWPLQATQQTTEIRGVLRGQRVTKSTVLLHGDGLDLLVVVLMAELPTSLIVDEVRSTVFHGLSVVPLTEVESFFQSGLHLLVSH